MRPLSRPAWEPRFEGKDAALVAQYAFGRFCATCERHLPLGGVAWLASAGRVVVTAEPADWPELLVLCRNCAEAAAAPRLATGAVLLPDHHATFAPAARCEFAYELRDLVVVGDGEPTSVPRVVVVPRSPAAAATIERFRLNTAYHQPVEDALVTPPGLELALVDHEDPRLEDRTRAWEEAERAAEAVRTSVPAARTGVVETILSNIRAGGYWSVWATVLWERLGDLELLETLLRHPYFPGTRQD